MNYKEMGLVSVVLLVLWIVTFFVSVDSLSEASFILYGDSLRIPIMSTIAVIITSLIPVVSYKLWVGYATKLLFKINDNEFDEDDDEEWERQATLDYGKR